MRSHRPARQGTARSLMPPSCGRIWRRPAGRCFAAELSALAGRGVILFGTSSRPALLAAVSLLVHSRPGAALCFVLGNATLLVAFLDMLGHPLLLAGVA